MKAAILYIYMLPLRSVGRSNFVRVCVNLTTLIQKRHILMRTAVLYIYIYMGTVATLASLYNVYLLTSVDVVPLMKTAGVVENSGHCTYSIGLKCF